MPTDLTKELIAALIDGADVTYEQVSVSAVVATVRPRHSSRTFTVRMALTDCREI